MININFKRKAVRNMKEYLLCVLICGIFVIGYEIVVVHGERKTYIFFGASEVLILSSVVKALIDNEVGVIAGIIVLQIAFTLFVHSYNTNTEKREIYNTLFNSGFITIIFSGLMNLKKEEYAKIQDEIEKSLGVRNQFKAKSYLFISYDNKKQKIIIRYIFRNKTDYERYIQKNIIDAKEVEEKGKGVSMVYTVNV